MRIKPELGIAAVAVVAALLGSCATYGSATLFENDQTYHYEALRSLGYAATGGADVNEVLITLGEIEAGDSESWHEAWMELAERVEAQAATYNADRRGAGRMLLKASNYYRTAEFLLHGHDERKITTYTATRRTFYAGLDALGVAFRLVDVPYHDTTLETLFLPSDGSTLILMINGYDSIKEETYLTLGAEAIARGYSFLSYDGPGQGASIRIHGTPMTHEWAPANRAVLDWVLEAHPEIETIVVVGFSLGSVFATKAAADDSRIDYLVHYDVFHDFAEAAGGDLPRRFREAVFAADGPSAQAARQLRFGMRFSSETDWAMRHGAWVMGYGEEYAKAFNAYRLYEIRDDAPLVAVPVLLLAGEEDHFVPMKMGERSLEAFSGTDDVTLIAYARKSGGAEHCRVGATTLFTADLFQWLAEREGTPDVGPPDSNGSR